MVAFGGQFMYLAFDSVYVVLEFGLLSRQVHRWKILDEEISQPYIDVAERLRLLHQKLNIKAQWVQNRYQKDIRF